MRHSLPAVLVATMLFSAQTWAQDDEETNDAAEGEGDNQGEEGEPAGSLADGPDPVDTETSDAGPYAPKGATGDKKVKKKKKEKEEKIKAIPRKKINGYVDVIGLFGSPPDPDRVRQESLNSAGTPTGDRGEVSGLGTVLAGMYDLDDAMSIGGRIPFSYTDIDALRLEGRDLQGTSMALGNPEFLFEYRVDQGPGAFIPIQAGLGIPVAFGDPNPASTDNVAVGQTMANLSMDAATGYHDSELYSVGRVPIALGAGYTLLRPSWTAYAATKFVTTIKIKGDDPNQNSAGASAYSYNPVGLRNVTGVGAMADVYKGILLGLDLWLAIDFIRELDYQSESTPPGKLQFAAEPGAGYKITDDIFVKLSYVTPLGGPLADQESIHAVRLRAGFAF